MTRLEGVRVLVTRPKERAQQLCFLLEDEGAEVQALPLLELCPPDDQRPLKAAAEQVHRFQWVAFASPSAVQGFLEAVREAGTIERLKQVKLAAVGASTAQSVREYGLEVALEPAEQTGGGLAAVLKTRLFPGDGVLLPAAQDGRRELQEALEGAGAEVTRVVAYKSVSASIDPLALEQMRQNPPHVIVFGSPRSTEAFLEAMGKEGKVLLTGARLVTLGPTTAQALRALGFEPAAVAADPGAEAVVEAIARALSAAPHPHRA